MNTDFIHPADQIIMMMERIYGYGMTTTSGFTISNCISNPLLLRMHQVSWHSL